MTVTSAAIPSSPRSTFHGVCKPGRSRPVRASRVAPVWVRGSGPGLHPRQRGLPTGAHWERGTAGWEGLERASRSLQELSPLNFWPLDTLIVCFSRPTTQKPSEGSGVRFAGGPPGSPRLGAWVLAESPRVREPGESSGASLHLSELGPEASA